MNKRQRKKVAKKWLIKFDILIDEYLSSLDDTTKDISKYVIVNPIYYNFLETNCEWVDNALVKVMRNYSDFWLAGSYTTRSNQLITIYLSNYAPNNKPLFGVANLILPYKHYRYCDAIPLKEGEIIYG